MDSRGVMTCHSTLIISTVSLQCCFETFQHLSLCCVKRDKNKTEHIQGRVDPKTVNPFQIKQLNEMTATNQSHFTVSFFARGP